ncbi:MAG TPA: hypothetical protein PK580_08875, partial [Nitrosomonas halophila]|nr:hypothetical protein [Nitrosomonas halophila]
MDQEAAIWLAEIRYQMHENYIDISGHHDRVIADCWRQKCKEVRKNSAYRYFAAIAKSDFW